MDKKAIVETARARMSESITADEDNREEALDDLKNLAGRQWPAEILTAREKEGRPCLTINRLPQFARQVTGDIRRLNPAIKVLAADSAASDDVAKIYAGMIRHIEARSDASSVYETAAESAAQCSMGAFRILAEYDDDASFEQEIRVQRIHNPFSVYWDAQAREPTREDAMFCFITDQMRRDDFEEEYPEAARVDVEHDGVTDGLEHWHDSGNVVVAEYFWKEPTDVNLALLRNGEVIEGKDIIEGMDIVKRRTARRHKVMWAKVSGLDVLEGPQEIPCKHIPVVAVIGEEMHIAEEVIRTSVIRFAKDPQRLYNYSRSAQTEYIALQPKAPFIGTAKQFTGFEAFWADANTSNRPYLPYNPDEKAPGPPQRSMPPTASQGFAMEISAAAEDMQGTTGIYNAGLGDRSNETSGVAIRQRQMESDIGTSVYADNLAKSIAHAGRILVDMIPRVYDTNRIVRVVGDDDQEKMVEINGMSYDLEAGIVPVNDLTHGKYDVRVTVGPNYTTRRQETQEGMMQFVSAFPVAGQVAGDLIAKAMDWPDAEKLADRLRKTLPPGLIPPDEMTPEEQQAAQSAMQMQQQTMQQQQAIQAQGMQLEFAKVASETAENQADAKKTEADARKTAMEAAQIQFELAVKSGQINEVIRQEVARALMGAMQQGQMPQI